MTNRPFGGTPFGQATTTMDETVLGSIPADDADVEQRLREEARGQLSGIIGGAMPVINTAVGAIGGGLVMLVTGIYFAASPATYRRGMVRLLPPEHRQRVDDSLARAGHTLRRWMVGSLINMTIVGLITGIALWLLDVPAALTLAVIAGLLEFVPIFGPLIASIPAIAIALTVTPLTASGHARRRGSAASPHAPVSDAHGNRVRLSRPLSGRAHSGCGHDFRAGPVRGADGREAIGPAHVRARISTAQASDPTAQASDPTADASEPHGSSLRPNGPSLRSYALFLRSTSCTLLAGSAHR